MNENYLTLEQLLYPHPNEENMYSCQCTSRLVGRNISVSGNHSS